MKRLLVGLTLLLACCSAKAQGWDYWYRLNSAFLPLNGGTAASGVGPYSGTPVLGDFIYFNGTNWVSLNKPADGTYSVTFTAGIPSWTAGGGGAPTNATYILETANGTLTNSFALGSLGTGLIINTTTTGVPTIMSAQTCTNQFVRSYSASGQATCSSILNGDIASNMIQAGTDGGAVAAQSASPGTQQGSGGNKNFNLNGIGILETDSLGPATAKGLVLQNTTASTGVTTTQWSPAVDWQGTGWNSSGSASQVAEWRAYVAPQTVAGTITSRFFIDRQDNGGGFTTELQIADNGTLTANGGVTATVGNITASGNNQIIQVTGTTNNGTGGLGYASTNGSSVLITAVRSLTGTCSGSTTCTGGTNLPANFIVLAVAVRITTAITGSTTYEIGTSNNPTAFCTGVTTVAINSTYACGGGSTNATGQSNTAAAAPLLTSTVGGNFTAGVVEMIFYGITVTLPTS